MASVPGSRRSTLPTPDQYEEPVAVLGDVSQNPSRRPSTKPPSRVPTKAAEDPSSKPPSRVPTAAAEDAASRRQSRWLARKSTAKPMKEEQPLEPPTEGPIPEEPDEPAEEPAADPEPVSDLDKEEFMAKHKESLMALDRQIAECQKLMDEALQLAEEPKDLVEPPTPDTIPAGSAQELGSGQISPFQPTSPPTEPGDLQLDEIKPDRGEAASEGQSPPVIAPRTSSRVKTSTLPVDGDITGEKGPSRAPTSSTKGPSDQPQVFNFSTGTDYEPKLMSRSGTSADTYNLKDKRYVDVESGTSVSLGRTHRRSPVSRDWPDDRKRFTAVITCINTVLIGLVIGIYAGEVPAIQYAIVDEAHFTILGNVVFFAGMAIPLLLLYPLPILHGRKPYTLTGLAILTPLLFPQALATEDQDTASTARVRSMLLIPRGLAGIAAGLVEMNLMPTLLDLFGASLQSTYPHGEIVDENDVRRHGGGMGIWLSVWTWCAIGSIGLGFFLGAAIITNGVAVTWGFYVCIIACAVILILNITAPETRRSPYRRSVAEVKTGTDMFRRIAKGEFMMHLYQTGPKHWYEEMMAG